MPDFDYKSFMAGLQAGRRLRLWDAGANKPPKPPAPTGRYILMEDGTPIVTEMNYPDGVTMFQLGAWYPYDSEVFPNYRLTAWIDSVEYSGLFFLAALTDQSPQYYHHAIIFDSQITTINQIVVSYDGRRPNGSIETGMTTVTGSDVYEVNGVYYFYYEMRGPNMRWPDESGVFEGSYLQMKEFIGNGPLKMLTE